MKNYKLEISYDGTRYYGWEHQPDRETVQGKLESVLSEMCGKSVEVIGVGRTDAGVHARAMIANVHMETRKTEKEIRDYMNHYLPEDISVNDLRECSDRFHARYNAVGKHYTYTLYVGELKPVFQRKYVTVLPYVPDVEKMKEAAAFLVGKHDFKSFCSNPNMKKSTVREIYDIEIVRRKDMVYLNFHGEGFLQNMVRIIVGTLLEVGRGKMEPSKVKEILLAKDRYQAGPTAPAQGLCLMSVDY